MTFRTRALTAGLAAAAAVAAVTGLLVLGGPDASPAANPAGREGSAAAGAVRTGCDQQSWAELGSGQQTSATFPGAADDRRNLVAGPLAILGGAVFVDAATAREFGGNKYALIVRAGHTATVSIPASARRTASLGYGPLPQGHVGVRDGHHTVTFVACPPGKPPRKGRSSVRFWMGFVMVSEPRCVPLDVYADNDRRPRRIAIELGARCAQPPPLRDCATHVEGPGPSDVAPLPGEIVVGPLRFAGLRALTSPGALAIDRVDGVYRVKAGVGVLAGVRATLSIAPAARSWAALNYARREPGKPRPHPRAAIRFQACAADHPAFAYDGPVGPITGFSGGFVLKRRGCVPLEVRVAGQPVVRARVPFGVGRCN